MRDKTTVPLSPGISALLWGIAAAASASSYLALLVLLWRAANRLHSHIGKGTPSASV